MRKASGKDLEALIDVANDTTKKLRVLSTMFDYFEWYLPSLHVKIAQAEVVETVRQIRHTASSSTRRVAL